MGCRAIKDNRRKVHLLWGHKDGFPEEVTFELSSERRVGISKLKSQREQHVRRPQGRKELKKSGAQHRRKVS